MADKTQKITFTVAAQDQATGVFSRINEGLDQLKQTTGSRGSLKNTLEILKGGGAIAGVTFGARMFDDATEAIVKMNAELASGAITGAEFADKFQRSLPIYGNIYSAWSNIFDLVSGASAEHARFTAESERQNEVLRARSTMLEHQQQIFGRMADIAEKHAREIAMIGATPEQREGLQRGFGKKDDLKDANTQYNKDFQQLDRDRTVERSSLRSVTAARKKEMEAELARGGGQRTDEYEKAYDAFIQAKANEMKAEMDYRKTLEKLHADHRKNIQIINKEYALKDAQAKKEQAEKDAKDAAEIEAKTKDSLDSFFGPIEEDYQKEQARAAQEQREQAAEAQLDAAKSEVDRLEEIANQKNSPVRLAGAESNRFLTGLSQAAKENNPIPMFVKAAKDQLDAAKQQVRKLDDILQQLRRGNNGNYTIPIPTT